MREDTPEEMAQLLERYRELRAKLSDLLRQVEDVDQEIVEIEQQLPDDYLYPDDAVDGTSGDGD
ncbi:MAG: hypothetical protein R3E01_30040 [Pirellulaceae bacterium]|nr:hypothetical protein [Planctomycetales bacterium]